MAKRTQKEIDRQVAGLNKQRASLPNFSFFGDDNWKPIEMQIRIIQGKARAENYEDENDRIASMALDAEEWLNGESDDDLFDNDE